ncbi:MAG: threonine--tRNA ligase [Candidatus Dormibacteraeota bacterium]|nr:threonine--tRNA ligase [Candidatus Dormibacteraeota bacterium]MBV9525029.1 threonine--tRNA ligase [Candidatus Dormibacteraeota bacterium]
MPDEVVDEAAEAGLPLEAPEEPSLEILRHSAAHLLAAAVTQLFPGAQYDVGPPIEDGFFYNFRLPDGRHFSDEDLAALQARTAELAAQHIPFTREVMPRDDARALFAGMGQDFKVDIIDRLGESVDAVGVYRTGDFVDLCRGPHVPDSGWLQAVKLLRVAGVYWRGDERNEQLQRVYGTAWFSEQDLDAYLERLAEAERRDHRRLGRELQLFDFDATAPGMPYWLPNGVIVLNELLAFWRDEHQRRGYQEIMSPLINEKRLWEISGHWDHYRTEMFVMPVDEQTAYGVKPMNCPNAMVVYNMRRHSYRELPLRLSDCDILHRFERSGTLHGLLRARKFQQDDAHIFVTEEQIEAEYDRIFEITHRFYSLFDLRYAFRLGTRPDDFIGDVETWDRAEAALLRILERHAGAGGFGVDAGEGAFYGPKIDIMMEDAIGRSWQMGTIQLDFQLPRRFGCTYVDTDGAERTPAVIHRVIYGSLERFVGVLIEHFAGHLPLWLAPVQCELVPVQDDAPEVMAYIESLQQRLNAAGLRAVVNDHHGERMQARVRDAELRKVPYVVVVGRRDVERGDDVVRVRDTRHGAQVDLAVDSLAAQLIDEVRARRPS